MKYLFVHQNFPGQFLHLVRHLSRDPANEILFITEANDNAIPGVRKFAYAAPAPGEATFPDAQEFEHALQRARIVEDMGRRLLALGFIPDIIIGHHGWGELLNLQDVWPGVPLLGYYEFYYRTHGLDVGFDPEFAEPPGGFGKVRAKNAVNLLALENPGHGQTPTRFQLSTYPDWAQPRISMLAEGVDLDVCRPDPAIRRSTLNVRGFQVAPGDTLVTFVSRDLEPYRGFHTIMRALPHLHRLRPDLKVVMVGGDGVSYGARLVGKTWREHLLGEVGHMIDPSRLCFPGRVPYPLFISLLQRSDAHVYLTYPFVLSWSLREALACGCAIVGSDTAPVREFIADRQNGLLAPFTDPGSVAERVRELLDDPPLARRVREAARTFAVENLGLDQYLAGYQALIGRVMQRS